MMASKPRLRDAKTREEVKRGLFYWFRNGSVANTRGDRAEFADAWLAWLNKAIDIGCHEDKEVRKMCRLLLQQHPDKLSPSAEFVMETVLDGSELIKNSPGLDDDDLSDSIRALSVDPRQVQGAGPSMSVNVSLEATNGNKRKRNSSIGRSGVQSSVSSGMSLAESSSDLVMQTRQAKRARPSAACSDRDGIEADVYSSLSSRPSASRVRAVEPVVCRAGPSRSAISAPASRRVDGPIAAHESYPTGTRNPDIIAPPKNLGSIPLGQPIPFAIPVNTRWRWDPRASVCILVLIEAGGKGKTMYIPWISDFFVHDSACARCKSRGFVCIGRNRATGSRACVSCYDYHCSCVHAS